MVNVSQVQRYARRLLPGLIVGVLLFCVYQTFSHKLEELTSYYWVDRILLSFWNKTLPFLVLVSILLYVGWHRVRSGRVPLSATDWFIVFYYFKYRFFESVWNFDRILAYTDVTYFDVIPTYYLSTCIYAAFDQWPRKKAKVSDPMIDLDIPLGESNPDDKLKRKKFADDVAKILLDLKAGRRALVIGINGPWGSGKTSLKYLINLALDKDKFVQLDFDPWLFTHSDSLTTSFLQILRRRLSDESFSASRSISAYARGLLSASEKFFVGSEFVQALSIQDSLDKQMHNTSREIARLKRTLVVWVDDIDRLSGEEAIEVLRLVRLVGDFPNTIYILNYDRDFIKEAVRTHLSEHGAETYLDKIVQVEFSIPEPEYDEIRKVFEAHMTNVIGRADVNEAAWDGERVLQVAQIPALRFIICHLRDIKRFANNFILRYRVIAPEVNFEQFTILELLRYKDPGLFRALFANRQKFLECLSAGQFDTGMFGASDDSRSDQERTDKPWIRELFTELVRYKASRNSLSWDFSFSNYFTLTLLDGYIQDADFDTAIKKSQEDEGLKKQMEVWAKTSPRHLLQHFQGYPASDSPEKLKSYMEHLVVACRLAFGYGFADRSSFYLSFVNHFDKATVDNKHVRVISWLSQATSDDHESIGLFAYFREMRGLVIDFVNVENITDKGWFEGNGRRDLPPGYSRDVSRRQGGTYGIFSYPFEFRLDNQIPGTFKDLEHVRFKFRPAGEYALYVMAKADADPTDYWFVVGDGQEAIKAHDGYPNEWVVTVPTPVEDNWRLRAVSVKTALERVTSKKFSHIERVGIRGAVEILSIQLF
jgi:hypothetical protein